MTRALHGARVLGAVLALAVAGPGESISLAQSENVLIILADDIGVDVLESYGEGSTFPPTPTIDMLRETGVLFRNAWSNPVCSTTRATIQTGRYGFRTGIGGVVNRGHEEGLPFSETLIPEMLDLNPEMGYQHAAIGKWHLTTLEQGGYDGPNLSGYGRFSGVMWTEDFPSYFEWLKAEDGATFQTTNYATTENVDDAIEWINDQGESPWFIYLAFNAPHGPFHAPPDELHSYEFCVDSPVLDRYQAMIEAMDTEMGRLFASIPQEVFERTNVIFLADNGTSSLMTEPPFDSEHAKHTLYEGGINVPLIISGPQVVSPGSESDVLVNTTDLFATALELMGVDVEASHPPGVVLDSLSLRPLLHGEAFEPRVFAYSAQFLRPQDETDSRGSSTPHGQAIRNTTGFKLIRFTTPVAEEFYNLLVDPFETTNLLLGDLDSLEQTNYDELTLELERLTESICQGDADSNGTVDPLDSGYVLGRYGCSVGTGDAPCDVADQNGDGQVDPLDTGFVVARFGDCP